MKEKENIILEFMKSDIYVPMKAKEMAVVLNVPKTEYATFLETLNHLENEYKIQRNRKSRYNLVKEEKYLVGIFRANEKGFGFVKVEGKDEEFYISKNNTKGALNEDKVVIETIEEGRDSGHIEGKVVKILSHERNTLVGTFTKSKTYGFVVPDDRKFGTDILFQKRI